MSDAYVETLRIERASMVELGKPKRVADIDAEIARVVGGGLVIEKATADPVVETAAKAAPAARKPKR